MREEVTGGQRGWEQKGGLAWLLKYGLRGIVGRGAQCLDSNEGDEAEDG